eukprot:4555650-Amphidinium_carterae.1
MTLRVGKRDAIQGVRFAKGLRQRATNPPPEYAPIYPRETGRFVVRFVREGQFRCYTRAMASSWKAVWATQ